jgi:hypothetical protein
MISLMSDINCYLVNAEINKWLPAAHCSGYNIYHISLATLPTNHNIVMISLNDMSSIIYYIINGYKPVSDVHTRDAYIKYISDMYAFNQMWTALGKSNVIYGDDVFAVFTDDEAREVNKKIAFEHDRYQNGVRIVTTGSVLRDKMFARDLNDLRSMAQLSNNINKMQLG